ncbi:hypothetical protein Ddc_17967 [Ditylenchus destructor]|nr:hypothetical protein Ddc_17967 [Ditylenchus destructor]
MDHFVTTTIDEGRKQRPGVGNVINWEIVYFDASKVQLWNQNLNEQSNKTISHTMCQDAKLYSPIRYIIPKRLRHDRNFLKQLKYDRYLQANKTCRLPFLPSLVIGPASAFENKALRMVSYDDENLFECFHLEQWHSMKIHVIFSSKTYDSSFKNEQEIVSSLAQVLNIDALQLKYLNCTKIREQNETALNSDDANRKIATFIFRGTKGQIENITHLCSKIEEGILFDKVNEENNLIKEGEKWLVEDQPTWDRFKEKRKEILSRHYPQWTAGSQENLPLSYFYKGALVCVLKYSLL